MGLNAREARKVRAQGGNHPFFPALTAAICEVDPLMPYAYTEDQLVEQSAIELFRELSWQTI